MSLDVVALLADLVRLPSVNPMGRQVSGDIYYEQRVTDFLERTVQRLGLAYERFAVSPQRDNLIIRVDGDESPEHGGPILMFEAHQDTVPIEGMTIDPFDPQIRDGRLYGRGSCDVKSGIAAMLCAVERMHRERPNKRATVILACTVNEEHGFTGATHWAETYAATPSRSQLLARAPDACVVAEPTLLNVVVAHKGSVRWRCHTLGRAGHSSQPQLADNALYHMARVLSALEVYARDIAPQLGSHPLVGQPTLSVGLIAGGISVNTVPDRCTIEIDRRLLPGDDPNAAQQHVIDWLSATLPAGAPVVHDPPMLRSCGLADDKNGAFAERLGAAARRHGAPGEAIGVPYGTDAPIYAATGCPTVVFGPGSIAQAHTADEWIALDQLRAAAEILFDLACDMG